MGILELIRIVVVGHHSDGVRSFCHARTERSVDFVETLAATVYCCAFHGFGCASVATIRGRSSCHRLWLGGYVIWRCYTAPVLVTGFVEVCGWADTLLVGAVPMLDTGAVEVGGWVGAAWCKTGSCTDMMAALRLWAVAGQKLPFVAGHS